MYEIYPKQLRKRKLPAKKNHCFILMPFSREFDEIYAEVKSALSEIGFGCNRSDDLYHNSPIMTTIVSEIISSHFIIADLTGKNPNVFYEVGIAHCFRDVPSVILISQDMASVPFDLRHLPVIVYSSENLKMLRVHLSRRVIENSRYFEGDILLRQRYYRFMKSEYQFDELLEFLHSLDLQSWSNILLPMEATDQQSPSTSAVLESFSNYEHELRKLAASDNPILFDDAFRIYRDALLSYSHAYSGESAV